MVFSNSVKYLLVRPCPSLRILFASPDLRTPGILQSPLLSRIGGSTRVRDDLAHALDVGRKVTAKVHWLSKGSPKSRARWIHCTPLLGVNDAVGVWMVILVDDEDDGREEGKQKADSLDMHNSSRPGPQYTAEALPWDSERQRAIPGVATSIWSDSDKSNRRADDVARSAPRRPLFRQPTDTGDTGQVTVRPGPKIAGKSYSFTSTSDRGIAAQDDVSTHGNRSRPTSSSSSNVVPIQGTMQPKVKFSGRPSLNMDAENARRPPVNMPYQSNESERDGKLPIRRTYKSLSPYGILFED